MNLVPLLAALVVSPLAPPQWLDDPGADVMFYKPAAYNWAIRRLPAFAQDMFATGVGHAMAYEALVTGGAPRLESQTYDQITWVLKHPPRLPVDEAALSPTFLRKYGYLDKVFEWAHLLHFQTIDVLMHPGWTDAQREAEIDRLWRFYSAEPYALTGLPMNMGVLDRDAYAKRFRNQYPKVNALFWGYHWLQTVNYDMLYRVPLRDQMPQYDVVRAQYRDTELTNVDRDVMPMTAEMSPRFAMRFPEIANAFDNLHMLHDNVNDILVSPDMTESQRQTAVKLAITRVLASSHLNERPGDGPPNTLHDHRHPPRQPGMGMMVGSDGNEMFMSGMGWMNMGECAHCSVPLPDIGPWGATVSASGWTMSVRCLLCARDMASETPGRAIIRAATEDPKRLLILISDDEGNWQSNIPTVVFLEQFAEHPECSEWSRAFTSVAEFSKYVVANPEFRDERPLDLKAWSALNQGRPKTYQKIDRPNPYRSGGGAPR